VDVLIAAVLGLIAWRVLFRHSDARSINEVSQALTIPRWWMYTFISFTTALAAVLALLARAHRHEHHGGVRIMTIGLVCLAWCCCWPCCACPWASPC
jgi:TRAP-type C4-dicarboxylate transport system permease small subunit